MIWRQSHFGIRPCPQHLFHPCPVPITWKLSRRSRPLMTKILLDTDIGTDVDDAVCLAYLLSRPDCELLGITTVMGEADKRASLASVLCRAAGKDIPIYPGAEQAMQVPSKQTVAPQAAALPR